MESPKYLKCDYQKGEMYCEQHFQFKKLFYWIALKVLWCFSKCVVFVLFF